jgi:dephospho-CoA kinase
MLRIGLTGGVASGKSTVADLFAKQGATVLDTDVIAREVTEPGQPALAALVAALGHGILAQDGRLDRAQLRKRLFADAELRQTVESILHPAILAGIGHVDAVVLAVVRAIGIGIPEELPGESEIPVEVVPRPRHPQGVLRIGRDYDPQVLGVLDRARRAGDDRVAIAEIDQ